MKLSDQELQTIITDRDGARVLVQKAEALGRTLAKANLSTSQIRALFGEVRQIQGQWSIGGDSAAKARRRLYLLKPKMAYRSRKEGRAVKQLVDVLDPALDQVLSGKDAETQHEYFNRFVEFFEAILAYHRAHGGK